MPDSPGQGYGHLTFKGRCVEFKFRSLSGNRVQPMVRLPKERSIVKKLSSSPSAPGRSVPSAESWDSRSQLVRTELEQAQVEYVVDVIFFGEEVKVCSECQQKQVIEPFTATSPSSSRSTFWQ
jgi:hypothetical protein